MKRQNPIRLSARAGAFSSLGVQLGVDMAANVLKEFWPDLERKFRRKHHQDVAANKSN